MKIVFLHMTIGLINRGSEISTDLLASQLSKNHQVFVVGGGEVGGEYQYQKIPIENSQFKQAPKNIFSKIIFRMYLDHQSKQIRKFTHKSIEYVRKFNPDIIIPINGKAQIKILKNNFPNKKIAIFGRAGIGWNDKDSIKQDPDLFIALSEKASKWAHRFISKKTKITYIPNPINIKKFKSSSSVKVDLTKPIVLVVGALTKYKNIDLVIKSVAKTKASLLVLGKGEEEESLKKLTQNLLLGRHLFTHTTYRDLPKYYQASDVFCFMPDSQEAFGRVYTEAMASGLPIVAPNDSIRKEIIGPKGFFSSHNSDVIAQNIQKALSSKKIDYSKELEKFSLEKVTKQIEKELKSL